MVFRRDRVKPTHYPRLPFHIIRIIQLLSSMVVASIMFYFISELARDRFKLPWTFVLVGLPNTCPQHGMLTTLAHSRRSPHSCHPYPHHRPALFPWSQSDPEYYTQLLPYVTVGCGVQSAELVVFWHPVTCLQQGQLGGRCRYLYLPAIQSAV
jgi:hypothetical protein